MRSISSGVLAVIADAWYIDTCIEEVGIRYAAHITQATDYSAFGAPLPGRTWYSSTQYRMGMNTQEKDNDVFVGAYTAEFWEYDSRTGRRWNCDLLLSYSESEYATFECNPIINVDPDGDVPGPSFRNRMGRLMNSIENIFRKRKLVYVDHDKPVVGGYSPSSLKNTLFNVKHLFQPDSRMTIPWGQYQVSDWQTITGTSVGGWDYYKLPSVTSKLWNIRVSGDRDNPLNIGYVNLKGLDNPGKKWKNLILNASIYPWGSRPGSPNVWPINDFTAGILNPLRNWALLAVQYINNDKVKQFASTIAVITNELPAPHRFRNMTSFKLKTGFIQQPSSIQVDVRTKDWNVIQPRFRGDLFRWYHGIPK